MFTEPFDGFDICPTILPRKSKNKQQLYTIDSMEQKEWKKNFFILEITNHFSFNNMFYFKYYDDVQYVTRKEASLAKCAG